ncbi:MAG: 4Fe-4S binding protein [Anaerolineae bacterium]|nr:4Fe-4S binding protein [Anaerolineae bacterium]
MVDDVYHRLARHLDDLPGGYPATESGVELRILQRLFTPEEARLALHLTLLPEEAPVIAHRAGLSIAEAGEQLATLARKGLCYRRQPKDGPVRYMAIQFAIGIWEFHVQDLDEGLVRDFDEYLPTLLDLDVWRRAPQLRTIPVGESIPTSAEVMPYEQAEMLIRRHSRFAIAPCICRRERSMVGEGCDRPLETCLSMGTAADYYVRNGLGRPAQRDEVLQLLVQADEAGLVLQPGNMRNAGYICMCCGDCCAVLRTVRRHPQPASIVRSAFFSTVNAGLCDGCGTCLERCQMDAIDLDSGIAEILGHRCIGCGLCVTTCPTGAATLQRRPEAEIRYVPRDTIEMHLRLGRARGKLPVGALVHMELRSQLDRLRARRNDS